MLRSAAPTIQTAVAQAVAAGWREPFSSSGSQSRQMEQLAAVVDVRRDAALSAQAAVAAGRATTADLGMRAVLLAAYCRRLQRLAGLLQHYDSHLQRTLAALGLAREADNGAAPGVESPAADALAASLRRLEQQLAAAVLLTDGSEAPTSEALLQLGSSPVPACVAAAGAPAVLTALQGAVSEDFEVVNAWPAVLPIDGAPEGALASGPAAAGPLSPAFGRLQQQQRDRWEVQAQREAQLQALREEVAVARAALVKTDGVSPETAARTQLAAQQSGLRAELRCLERLAREAAEHGSAAAAQAAHVQAGVEDVASLELKEARVDAAVRALCAADSRLMREWRQGTWRAQEQVETGVARQRQPLLQLAQQLLEAQCCELAAFRGPAPAAAAQAGEGTQAQAAAGRPGEGSPSASTNLSAAQLLDPLAHLRTVEHAGSVMAAAAGELAELQPVQQQWTALAAVGEGQLAALRKAAHELAGRVQALQDEGGATGAAMEQLREAAAAAEEAGALVARTRQALSEWWTSPAVTAAPWVKRGDKSADEWLRLLSSQQRALRQREAFTGKDHSNQMLLRQLR